MSDNKMGAAAAPNKPIEIDLSDTTTPISHGAIIDRNAKFPAPNLIPSKQIVGPHWAVKLPPGSYLFICSMWGKVGPSGPLKIADASDPANKKVLATGNGQIDNPDGGGTGTGYIQQPFIVT